MHNEDSDYVTINGAKIDLNFFKDNVSEAKECEWSSEVIKVHDEHVHCIVCGIPLPQDSLAFNADFRWLCHYCMRNFIEE